MTEAGAGNRARRRLQLKNFADKAKSYINRACSVSVFVLVCTLITSTFSLLWIFGGVDGLRCRVRGSHYWSSEQVKQYQPRHVHLAYGDNQADIVVVWSTVDDPGGTFVRFGKKSTTERIANGTAEEFTTSGTCGLTQYIHRVTLTNLEPGERYIYHCGSDKGWSPRFIFTAMKNGTDWSSSVAVFGDLGAENAMSLSQLQKEAQQGEYDAVLHIGDFAYNLESEGGLVGNVFMDGIQSIAAYVPYMTSPGNHENDNNQNFREYKTRFTMPRSNESMIHSWNVGPVHFVSINSEAYYGQSYDQACEQYEWLHQDLEMANAPEVRNERPWVIVYAHRPMYCSNKDSPCIENNNRLRTGVPNTPVPGLEQLLAIYGVDLAIWAHVHSYERLFPLYDTVIYNGSVEEPYTDPGAPTHVITGSAGCKWEHDPFPEFQPPWSAFRALDYGYSRFKVINTTHLYFEQISIDQNNQVIDSFTLVRNTHENYPRLNVSRTKQVCSGVPGKRVTQLMTVIFLVSIYRTLSYLSE